MPMLERLLNTPWFRPVLALVAVGIFIALWRVLPVEVWVNAALQRVDDLGPWGIALFALLYIPACLTFFPDVILNGAAGMLWGVGGGAAIVSVARLGGASVTFYVVRHLSANWQRHRLESDPRLAAIRRAVVKDAFKIALMLRLSPAFPIPVIHVGLALTGISYPTFLLSTLIGCIPRTLVMAYLGAGARSLSTLGEATTGAALPPWVFWSGLVLTVCVTTILTRYARRALREAAATP